MKFPYVYSWKNNEKRLFLYGRTCLVVKWHKSNTCVVEFQNGQRETVSRNALKKAPAETEDK